MYDYALGPSFLVFGLRTKPFYARYYVVGTSLCDDLTHNKSSADFLCSQLRYVYEHRRN